MAEMTVSEARGHLPAAIATARHEAVFLRRRGKSAAVLVSPERYEQLIAAWEEASDLADFDAAMGESGANIRWERVKADLGWT